MSLRGKHNFTHILIRALLVCLALFLLDACKKKPCRKCGGGGGGGDGQGPGESPNMPQGMAGGPSAAPAAPGPDSGAGTGTGTGSGSHSGPGTGTSTSPSAPALPLKPPVAAAELRPNVFHSCPTMRGISVADTAERFRNAGTGTATSTTTSTDGASAKPFEVQFMEAMLSPATTPTRATELLGSNASRLNGPLGSAALICALENPSAAVREELVKWLLENNANPNEPVGPLDGSTSADKSQVTPIHVAINLGEELIIDKLLEKGADPNRASKMNRTGGATETERLPISLAIRQFLSGSRLNTHPANRGGELINRYVNIINKLLDFKPTPPDSRSQVNVNLSKEGTSNNETLIQFYLGKAGEKQLRETDGKANEYYAILEKLIDPARNPKFVAKLADVTAANELLRTPVGFSVGISDPQKEILRRIANMTTPDGVPPHRLAEIRTNLERALYGANPNATTHALEEVNRSRTEAESVQFFSQRPGDLLLKVVNLFKGGGAACVGDKRRSCLELLKKTVEKIERFSGPPPGRKLSQLLADTSPTGESAFVRMAIKTAIDEGGDVIAALIQSSDLTSETVIDASPPPGKKLLALIAEKIKPGEVTEAQLTNYLPALLALANKGNPSTDQVLTLASEIVRQNRALYRLMIPLLGVIAEKGDAKKVFTEIVKEQLATANPDIINVSQPLLRQLIPKAGVAEEVASFANGNALNIGPVLVEYFRETGNPTAPYALKRFHPASAELTAMAAGPIRNAFIATAAGNEPAEVVANTVSPFTPGPRGLSLIDIALQNRNNALLEKFVLKVPPTGTTINNYFANFLENGGDPTSFSILMKSDAIKNDFKRAGIQAPLMNGVIQRAQSATSFDEAKPFLDFLVVMYDQHKRLSGVYTDATAKSDFTNRLNALVTALKNKLTPRPSETPSFAGLVGDALTSARTRHREDVLAYNQRLEALNRVLGNVAPVVGFAKMATEEFGVTLGIPSALTVPAP